MGADRFCLASAAIRLMMASLGDGRSLNAVIRSMISDLNLSVRASTRRCSNWLMARRRVFVLNQTLTTTAISATATAKLAHSPTYCQPTTALLIDVDSRHTARSAGYG